MFIWFILYEIVSPGLDRSLKQNVSKRVDVYIVFLKEQLGVRSVIMDFAFYRNIQLVCRTIRFWFDLSLSKNFEVEHDWTVLVLSCPGQLTTLLRFGDVDRFETGTGCCFTAGCSGGY